MSHYDEYETWCTNQVTIAKAITILSQQFADNADEIGHNDLGHITLDIHYPNQDDNINDWLAIPLARVLRELMSEDVIIEQMYDFDDIIDSGSIPSIELAKIVLENNHGTKWNVTID